MENQINLKPTRTYLGLTSSHTIPDRRCVTLVSADVGCLAGITVTKIWNHLSRLHPRTAGGQLEEAGLGCHVQTGAFSVDRLAAHTVRFLADRYLAVEKVVIEIIVNVPAIVAGAMVLW